MRAVRRLVGVLPPGTLAVGAGLGVLGAAAYVHLAVAGHALDPADMSSVSVLWSIVFAVGPGLFLPIEQEVSPDRRRPPGAGQAPGPVLRRGATLAAVILLALLTALLAGSGPVADRLFAGDRSLVWVLAGALGGLALAHTARGVLGGLGHFGWYGAQLGVDGALRIAMAGALGAFGVGVECLVRPGPRPRSDRVGAVTLAGPARPRRRPAGRLAELCRGLGLLVVSALLAQVVVNVAVVNVRLLDPGRRGGGRRPALRAGPGADAAVRLRLAAGRRCCPGCPPRSPPPTRPATGGC